MRIVKRTEFLKLPAETVFTEYEPCHFGDLLIKGDTLHSNDFCYQQIVGALDAHDSNEWSDMLFRSAETGESLPMDFDSQGHDGSFDPDDKLYAVWERKDVEALIARLQQTLIP